MIYLFIQFQRETSPRPRPEPWLLRRPAGQAPYGSRSGQLRRRPWQEATRCRSLNTIVHPIDTRIETNFDRLNLDKYLT